MLQSYQQRVVDEKNELDNKIKALDAFIDSSPIFDKLSEEDQNDFILQLSQMKDYSFTLGRRISRF